ncbi:MAG TPA: hypothetical protein VFB84_22205 [Micromonosporaceae bacterium]|nr:hypothetical protein [Micromonosporaceae bacterium]
MSVAATLERFAATMPRAAADEINVAQVRLFGARGWVAYQPNHDQRRLRQAHAIGPVGGLDLIDTLMGLPLGLPVPVRTLSRADQRRLRRLPDGAVTWSGTAVTRRLAPPVAPLLAMVHATDWSKGLRAASRFAMYCRRLLVIPTLPHEEEVALAQASFYGIGVALLRNGTLTMVLESVKVFWTPSCQSFCSWVGSLGGLIQATVGSLGGSGGWLNRSGLRA